MTFRSNYFARIETGFYKDVVKMEQEIESWQHRFAEQAAYDSLLGYQAPKFPLQLAVVAAFLYEQTKDEQLAFQARDCLLRYREFIHFYPESSRHNRPEYEQGVPPLDAVFDPVIFAPACERIKPITTASEYQALGEIAADSLRPIWRFPEWGGHNRAMLRAASLATCAHAFPDHPEVTEWISMADELAEESWGRWSIEDAMMYQSHWLRSMVAYAEARNKPEISAFIQPRMHLLAMVQLLSPMGLLPDFGDSHWLMHSHWEWLSMLEWGAANYQDASMKWAADRIWQALQAETPNLYSSSVLTLAWRWAADAIPAQTPHATPDALDDLIIKKLVFRTGWDPSAAYACVNYRDEGDYGRVARDYLRTNLAVSAEKMHHGHADEGSFCMLMHNGTLLLHESGYREQPPDGIYRADVYHNRLVWRPGEQLPDRQTWSNLQDNGHYKPVRTERLYQSQFCGVDVRRIRMTDEKEGLGWDRSIFFLSGLPCWVVVDSVMALRSAPRTLSLLWWVGEILDQGQAWFKTYLPGIQAWRNQPNSALNIFIPEILGQTGRIQVEKARRCFQEEMVISTTWSGHHLAGRSLNFVSLLLPQPYQTLIDVDKLNARVITSQPYARGIGVEFTFQQEHYLLATLNDLAAGTLQEDIRPRYQAEQAWMKLGPLASDAAYSVVIEKAGRINAGFLNGTRLEYHDRVLYQAPMNAMFQEDRSHRPGIPARFRWEGEG